YKYVTISDKKLDETIYHVLKTTPTIGLAIMTGKLKTLGIRVPRQRVRDSYSRVLVAVGNPFRRRIQRRMYCVRAPLS
ncbi:Uncharacterized protein APZ42_001061, partial [Daphnia magna]